LDGGFADPAFSRLSPGRPFKHTVIGVLLKIELSWIQYSLTRPSAFAEIALLIKTF
jgi:hypothetical protein